MTKRILPIAIAGAAIPALVLTGCSSDGGGGAAAGSGPDFEGLGLSAEVEEELTALYDEAIESGQTDVMIYAGHHDEFVAIYEGFEARFPGLTVSTGSYYGAELQSLLEAENETGRHVASVISNPNGDRYAEQGFVQPYELAVWEVNPALEGRVDPTQLTDGEHMYYSPWTLMFNMSYNTELLDEADLPATWAELGGSEWNDKLTFMNPGTPGGTMTTLTQLVNAGMLTEDDLRAIGANTKIVATDQLALQGISSGEFPLQPLSATTSIINAANQGAPVEVHFLEEGNVIATEKWMLANGAPAEAAAKVFLNYLHTVDAQEQALKSGNFPTNQDPSLTSPYGWPALEDVDFVTLEPQEVLRPAMAEYTPMFQSIFTE
ncbi:ABC transporter substrate-binding protein [Microbacterium album]|uniref:ABC transporter substrate-binding protein n=1 Tax=Microbacterium album TaxID=2053191 RepID=UPI00166379F0|nr:extracellular solute-binding protein [Microbacterium album]